MSNKEFVKTLPQPAQDLHRMIEEMHDYCAENGISVVIGALIDDNGADGTCYFISKNGDKSQGSPLLLLHAAMAVITKQDEGLTTSAIDVLNLLVHHYLEAQTVSRVQ